MSERHTPITKQDRNRELMNEQFEQKRDTWPA